MNEFWQARTERERILLIISAALMFITTLNYAIASPLMQWRADSYRQAARAETTYELVRDTASGVKAGKSIGNSEDPQIPIRNLIIQSSRAGGVTLNFVNARNDGVVELSVEPVSPTVLFRWLSEIHSRYEIEVILADISRDGDNPELVRAQFSFRSM